ncbi:hypothetical protein Hypma_011733 [Hypsizygus marmoreus]|uniref:DUF7918 domain-containing protein n=1 Tax=Hypsizygus marmoreus TaxID=39966 RepID=A0A369JP25_HYPMA|nr:hypothetical protein Hypma_011733 [Hypsizygus marmoreus]
MLNHRGFSAWIEVDGQAVPEYLVALDEASNRVSCWIPSEEGKRFSVFWRDNGGNVETCSFITLDGLVVPGRFLAGSGTTSREGVRTSPTSERPFVFQKVNETSNEPIVDVAGKEVGMIVLRIKRVVLVGARPSDPIQELPKGLLGKRKAGDLRVGFGEETRNYDQHPTTWAVMPHDKDIPGARKPSTFVSFVFRYRSQEFLESQGIIPEPTMTLPVPLQRPQARRVVSLPSNMPAPEDRAPPRKKPRLEMNMPPPTSYAGPSTRRTASCRVVPTARQTSYPGEGMFMTQREGVLTDSGNSSPDLGDSQPSGTE